MAERSEKLQSVSETEIVTRFRDALVALLPTMQALDCVEDDTSLYDPFDRVADALWSELVLNSFQWKYGLEQPPSLPAYGLSGAARARDGEVQVFVRSESRGRLVAFHGNRAFGAEHFNAVSSERHEGASMDTSVSKVTEYRWVRSGSTI
jgi:hypothetical protein